MESTLTKKKFDVKKIVVLGMLAAAAYGAMALTHSIPLSPLPFLTYDAKDVIIVIGGFMFGPLPALLLSLVVSALEAITLSSTGIIGFAMNVLSSCGFALTASIIYKQRRSLQGAIIGLVSGMITASALMLLWNYLITPLYMDISREQIVGMLASIFLPYNLIKAGLNAIIAMLLYKPLAKALKSVHLLPNEGSAVNKKATVWVYAVSFVMLAAVVVLALLFIGVL